MELVMKKRTTKHEVHFKCPKCDMELSNQIRYLQFQMKHVFARTVKRTFLAHDIMITPYGSIVVDWHLVHNIIGDASANTEIYNSVRRSVLDATMMKVSRIRCEYEKYKDFNDNIGGYIAVEKLVSTDGIRPQAVIVYQELMKYMTKMPGVRVPEKFDPEQCICTDIQQLCKFAKRSNNYIKTYNNAVYYSRQLVLHALVYQINSLLTKYVLDKFEHPTLATENFKTGGDKNQTLLSEVRVLVKGRFNKEKNEQNWVDPQRSAYARKKLVMYLDEIHAALKQFCTDKQFEDNDAIQKINMLVEFVKNADASEGSELIGDAPSVD